MVKKIKSKNGETIVETLVATLIAALSMVMFAGMVMGSKKIIEDTNKLVKEYYEGSSQLISKEKISGTSVGSLHITVYTNKNGLMYYEYNNTGSTEDSGDSGDTGQGT